MYLACHCWQRPWLCPLPCGCLIVHCLGRRFVRNPTEHPRDCCDLQWECVRVGGISPFIAARWRVCADVVCDVLIAVVVSVVSPLPSSSCIVSILPSSSSLLLLVLLCLTLLTIAVLAWSPSLSCVSLAWRCGLGGWTKPWHLQYHLACRCWQRQCHVHPGLSFVAQVSLAVRWASSVGRGRQGVCKQNV